MNEYIIYLFRSGRVWVMPKGDHTDWQNQQSAPPLLVAHATANSEVAAIGKVLLEYVDRANQPYQHIPICIEWCCEPCVCGLLRAAHTPAISHTFTPIPQGL